MAIPLTCRCGKQFYLDDKFGGKRIRCPACADAMDVPPRAVLVPGAPPSGAHAVGGSAPQVRPRWAKPASLPADAPTALPALPVRRYVWLWVSIAAVVPVALVSVVLALVLSRTADDVVADKTHDKQSELQPAVQLGARPAKVKVKTNVHPQAKAPAPPTNEAQAGLTQRVQHMLKANCYRCHGQDGENEGGLNYVVDLGTLVSRNKVVPGKPDDSLVFRRVTAERRPMPPKGETPRPTDADIAALKQWIEEGAPALVSGEDDRDFIADADILQYIHDDLQKVEERARRFTRYFTISHLYNAGRSEDELQTFRLALSKLVNSLSWERDIEVPRPIDPGKTILRVDLRHYQWTAAVWKRILAEYPYAVTLPGETARAVYSLTDCELPYARGDWFVYARRGRPSITTSCSCRGPIGSWSTSWRWMRTPTSAMKRSPAPVSTAPGSRATTG